MSLMMYHIFKSPVIYYFTDPRQDRIYIYDKKGNFVKGIVIYASVLQYIMTKNRSNAFVIQRII